MHAALVFGGADARDQPRHLQSLEQRGQRAGVEIKLLAQRGNGEAIALPQHQHDKVLRVGEPEVLKQWLVELGHCQRGRIQRKAELVVQFQHGGGLVG